MYNLKAETHTLSGLKFVSRNRRELLVLGNKCPEIITEFMAHQIYFKSTIQPGQRLLFLFCFVFMFLNYAARFLPCDRLLVSCGSCLP